MWTLKLVKNNVTINFMRLHMAAFALSALLVLAAAWAYIDKGLNFGIDFAGGTLIEISAENDINIAALRERLTILNLGEVQIQEFGAADTVLIRVAEAEGAVDARSDLSAVQLIRAELEGEFEFRRVEIVGPQISAELIEAGIYAFLAALAAMLIYIWFRFEWQFSLGAVFALVHDVLLTVGMFAAFQLEFNLSILAAVLTIIGYSMNDTVVVYDRVRENLRKYKKMPLVELLNLSINNTLSRTVMTSVTTLLALGALYALGGEVIHGFAIAMIWGVFIGTYSSIFIAAPLLIYLGVKRDWSSA